LEFKFELQFFNKSQDFAEVASGVQAVDDVDDGGWKIEVQVVDLVLEIDESGVEGVNRIPDGGQVCLEEGYFRNKRVHFRGKVAEFNVNGVDFGLKISQ